jgi:hypothetical protein
MQGRLPITFCSGAFTERYSVMGVLVSFVEHALAISYGLLANHEKGQLLGQPAASKRPNRTSRFSSIVVIIQRQSRIFPGLTSPVPMATSSLFRLGTRPFLVHASRNRTRVDLAAGSGQERCFCSWLLLGVLLLLTGYCQAQTSPQYHLQGEIKALADGTRLYLINGNQRKVIDSATVTQQRFSMQGHLAEPAHMYLHAGRGSQAKKLADILLDNQTVSVTGPAPDYDQITVRGSAIDQQWKEWWKEDQQLGRQRAQLKQVVQSLLAKKDTANANTLTKLVGEMQGARVTLLKAYVRRYHDTAAGAALPNLCTLQSSLTGADYLEMYRSLTPVWQQSSFGQDILSQATKKASAK